ncbi:hypothetical protein HOY80DRAFT_113085 [Tuber brumale]|nr:hypothetical protein HOY80DRAFT_113085 [Tuber brumale]
MSENIMASRVEKLEEQVQKLSQNVETLLAENIVLHQKSNKSDEWIVLLLSGYRKVVQHVVALEARCSTLEHGIDLQRLKPNSLNTAMGEEKSLNSDQFLGQTAHPRPPHAYGFTGLAQGECMAAMELNRTLQSRIESQEAVSNNENSQFESSMPDFKGNALETPPETGLPTPPNDWNASQSYGYPTFPRGGQTGGGLSAGAGGNGSIAAIPMGRKRIAQEMSEGGLNTTLSSSNSNGVQLTFVNTFSDGCPPRNPAHDKTWAAKKLKSWVQPRTHSDQPMQEQQVHEEPVMLQKQEESVPLQVQKEFERVMAIDDVDVLLRSLDESFNSPNYLLCENNNWASYTGF